MADEKPAKLDYDQVDLLEQQGKKLTGKKLANWGDGKGLCGSCKWASIIRQESRNTRVIQCGSIGKRVPEDIVECSDYQNFTQLTLSQMSSIATLIGGFPERKVGFHK